jgi:hypothetical protein
VYFASAAASALLMTVLHQAEQAKRKEVILTANNLLYYSWLEAEWFTFCLPK